LRLIKTRVLHSLGEAILRMIVIDQGSICKEEAKKSDINMLFRTLDHMNLALFSNHQKVLKGGYYV